MTLERDFTENPGREIEIPALLSASTRLTGLQMRGMTIITVIPNVDPPKNEILTKSTSLVT